MGLFTRKPRLGDPVRITLKKGLPPSYGIVVTYDTVGYIDGRHGYKELRISAIEICGKVERCPEEEVPRREYRAISRQMGGITMEEMAGGPAPEDELDRRWEMLQALRRAG